MDQAAAASSSSRVSMIEQAVQLDEGGRGIAELIVPGELEAAARALLGCKSVAVLTGFPCMLDHDPPTETDGPPGALAVARACIALGMTVHLPIDETNAAVLQAAVAGSGLEGPALRLEVFPPRPRWTEADDGRLRRLAAAVDAVVAIERAGPGRDGGYYTMRARRMDELLAPLERLIELVPVSVGIGDGGNEVGMGKVLEKIEASQAIPNARRIACVVPARHLIVASVSNWGGYALTGALAVVAAAVAEEQQPGAPSTLVDTLLVSDADELALLDRIVAAGARDGITGERRPWVDGMPGEASIRVLREIRAIARGDDQC